MAHVILNALVLGYSTGKLNTTMYTESQDSFLLTGMISWTSASWTQEIPSQNFFPPDPIIVILSNIKFTVEYYPVYLDTRAAAIEESIAMERRGSVKGWGTSLEGVRGEWVTVEFNRFKFGSSFLMHAVGESCLSIRQWAVYSHSRCSPNQVVEHSLITLYIRVLGSR